MANLFLLKLRVLLPKATKHPCEPFGWFSPAIINGIALSRLGQDYSTDVDVIRPFQAVGRVTLLAGKRGRGKRSTHEIGATKNLSAAEIDVLVVCLQSCCFLESLIFDLMAGALLSGNFGMAGSVHAPYS
ncbi:hypothetical protein [Pseudomonas viridiflava]|uniref:hypothetical protein n=1 Tax=Pseudomonas viridiflava TaxID=33069 RepID=UPI0013CE4D81|nr:hypothetical protein [Pseudomonas viridiflava]